MVTCCVSGCTATQINSLSNPHVSQYTTIKRIYRTKRIQIYTILLLIILMTTLKCVWDSTGTELVVVDLNYTNQMLEDDLVRSIIENRGQDCVIPKLNPFDKEAMRFDLTLPKVTCDGVDWVECFIDECYVVKPILESYKNVWCIYRDILHIHDFHYVIGPPKKVTGDQKYKLRKSDHVKVSCMGTMSSGDPRPVRWFGHRAGLRRLPPKEPRCCGPHLNVLMVCLDSTSRAGFIRKMPHTRAALEEMGAVFLNGYNIVGDGTPAALFPILTGKSELEFPEMRRKFTKSFIDDNDFIFKQVSRIGYRTAYFEDSPFLGTFQYRFNGFGDQPADHYLLSLLQEAYGEHSKSKSRDYCFGAMPLYGLLLNLTHQFTLLDGHRFSLTFIADVSHDNFSLVSTADEDLASFLRRLQQGGKTQETVLFVMGDHGTRFSPIRETLQGKLEERLPLLAIVLPKLLLQTRPRVLEALRANAEVLTTPFDVHSTLLDILGIGDLRNRYRVPGASMPRGNTLLQPIPSSRGCGEAGVSPHWCVCALWRPLALADPAHARVANALAGYVNNVTAEYRFQCLHRQLVTIESVLELTPNQEMLRFEENMDADGYLGKFSEQARVHSKLYQAKIVMSPGRAVFEGSVKYFPLGDYFAITDRDVSRINAYGNESACISAEQPHLAKFCLCIEDGIK